MNKYLECYNFDRENSMNSCETLKRKRIILFEFKKKNSMIINLYKRRILSTKGTKQERKYLMSRYRHISLVLLFVYKNDPDLN